MSERMETRWGVYPDEEGVMHVKPLADLLDHETSERCWCRPFERDGVMVHNSADQREESE